MAVPLPFNINTIPAHLINDSDDEDDEELALPTFDMDDSDEESEDDDHDPTPFDESDSDSEEMTISKDLYDIINNKPGAVPPMFQKFQMQAAQPVQVVPRAFIPQPSGSPMGRPVSNIPQPSGVPMFNVPQLAPQQAAPQRVGPKLNIVPGGQFQPLPPTGVFANVAKPPTTVVKPEVTKVNVEEIISKMPNINVVGGTNAIAPVTVNVEDMLKQDVNETPQDFEARRRLTIQLANIPDYKLNNTTAITVASMIMHKAKLGVTYDPDVEAAIAYLKSLLQR